MIIYIYFAEYVWYNKSMKNMELLSPASSFSALKQAVFNGADSIYLGIKQFNARNNIEGFDLNSLKEAVEFAHLHNVKVYLAINILFKDEELLNAVNIVAKANNIGVDAFIVQDIGLAQIIHKSYPNIILHASTQLAVHNLEGAQEALKLGFSRVVLARETPLQEIERISKNCKIELEFFAQGALCVSFSGNCYMCSCLKNKSGNRGECLQFCRLKYNLLNNGKNVANGYLLSAKDICMLNMIEKLKQAGVGCLKIEGRARRDFYVATATKIYRKALDNESVSQSDLNDLRLAFNREYTPAYLEGNDKIISKVQGHNGIQIGRVVNINKGKKFNEVFIDTEYHLQSPSTLKFLNDGQEVASISAVDIKQANGLYRITTTNNNIAVGNLVNILSDETLEKDVLNINNKLKIYVNIVAKENTNIDIIISVNDTKYHHVGDVLDAAQNAPITADDLIKSFSKSELFEPIVTVAVGRVFIPKGKLNEIRRNCYERLYNQIQKSYLIKNDITQVDELLKLPPNKKQSKIIETPMVIDSVSHFDKGGVNNNSAIIYDPQNYTLDDVDDFVKLVGDNTKIYLNLPNFATHEDIVVLKEIVEKLQIGVVANNLYALNFDAPKIAGGFLNIYNSYTVNFLQERGINVFYTKELSENEIKDISKKTGAKILQDKKHYMTLRHCPIKHFVGGNCSNCKYCDGLVYKMQDGTKFKLKRKKVKTCTFYLESV